MARKRNHIGLKTKLASALLIVGGIPHEHAKLMTEDQILSLFQWDHYPIPHAHDGPDFHWNINPSFIAMHKEKTNKVDKPMIAKGKRIMDRDGLRKPKKTKHPLRSRSNWPKGRKMQSRGWARP